MSEIWKLEDDVNDYVKNKFSEIGLKKLKDYNVESSMSDYMKDALKGSAKTKTKTNFGKPDFHVENYNIPVIFEDKLGVKKLIAKNKDGIKDDEKSIKDFATNGAIHYATQIIASGKYKEAVAIGVAGDHKENVVFDIYYVFGSSFKSIKKMENYTGIDFLENKKSFSNFYNDCVLTEEEKHEILITSRNRLQKYAGELNKLMHNHNITAPQRVLYVSGMLLSMQDIIDKDGNLVQRGLIPEDLLGAKTDTKRDGILITDQIKEYLKRKQIRQEKVDLMLSSFSEISKDNQRDEPTNLDKLVGKLLEKEASTNKQIFTYIFNNIYMSIDAMAGHLDIMGEMYSEFLKYALGDGKEIGIVLTPPYVTKMMAEILNVNKDSRTMDLATGFRVIIVIEANSYVNTRSSRLLPKFKTQKINSWCAF